MPPHDIHFGLAAAKWQQRAEVLPAAYAAHPERFPRGVPVPPPLPTAARIKLPAATALAVPVGRAQDGESQSSDADCPIPLGRLQRQA